MIIFWCYNTCANQITFECIDSNIIESYETLIHILDTDIWKTDVSLQKTMLKENELQMNLETIALLLQHKQFHKENQQYEFNKQAIKNTLDKKEIKYKMNNSVLSILYKFSRSVYLTLKCKYADLIWKLLHYIFEIISLCQTIQSSEYQFENCINDSFTHFVKQKKYFVKIIFYLFIFLDKFPNLKYSDQILLKSLLVIISYMNFYTLNSKTRYDNHDNYFVIYEINKKIVAQMINLLERFRYQKCVINIFNYFEEYKLIQNKIQAVKSTDNLSKNFSKLFDHTSKYLNNYLKSIVITNLKDSESPEHNEEMYDTKYLILEYILTDGKYSNIGTLLVKEMSTNKEIMLNDLFKNTLRNYNIKTVFDFQMLFVNVIIDLCNIQLYHFNDTHKYSGNSYLELQRLLINVKLFIDLVLPNNYSRNQINSWQKLYDTIQDNIFTYSNDPKPGRYIITNNSTLQKIKINTIVNWEKHTFIYTLPMSDLIHDIISHKYFNSFFRFFKLFLSEPNTFEDYRLYGINDKENTNGRICFNMSKLREQLFMFEALMIRKKKKMYGTNLAILKATDIINNNLAYLYKEYIDYKEIRNILVPLSIHFKNSMHSILTNFDSLILEQQSLLATNLLEHFEINNCAVIQFNVDMFLKIFKDRNMVKLDGINNTIGFDCKYIVDKMLLFTMMPKVYDYTPLMWTYTFIANDFYMYYKSQFNSNVINWDGMEDKVDNVFLSIKQNVIDYTYLIRFQLFKIKWFIYNIFKKMLYIAIYRKYYTLSPNNYFDYNEATLTILNDDLLRLLKLPFPGSIGSYLKPIFKAYNNNIFIETDTINFENRVQEVQDMIRRELKYLDIVTIDNTLDKDNNVRLFNQGIENNKFPKTIISLHQEFDEDYNFLEKVLKSTQNGKKTLISKEDFLYIY